MIRIVVFIILLVVFLSKLPKLIKQRNIRYKDLLVKQQSIFIQYVLGIIGLVSLSYAFKLKWSYISLLILTSLFIFSYILTRLEIFSSNYDETMQLILVMTHLSHQFKNHQKIENALQGVLEVCNDQTRDKLKEVEILFDNQTYQTAFSNFHDHYLIKTLVTTMAHAQQEGDDHINHALLLIEQDIDELNNHIYLYIQKMNFLRNRILLLSIFGMGVTLVSQNMLNMVVDLSSLAMYQDVVFIFLLIMLILLALSFNIMSLPLIMKEECLE